jgi:acetyl esterase/lipase
MDVVSPASPASKEDPVVFCHGGGFVCVQGELLMPSMTFVARYGMTMYSVNYPFAPEEAFPSQVVAILRACAWIKKHSGQSTVKLIGDSAGGSLVRL